MSVCPPPSIYLAPMEGVVTAPMRALLTALGGIDRCVTEFVRVTDQLLPARVFHRYCPELLADGLTPSGVPVHVQLLGSNPDMLAANAQRVATLGARGIDLNFGCPAKTVNRHRGGSVLLREPELLHAIVHAVRQAVPGQIPVSAKIRLGYEDHALLLDNAQAIAAAGAAELTIHARTREDGYKPPAYWCRIRPVADALAIPVIANGEIWCERDYLECRRQSGCAQVMLGRGVLSRPDLPRRIRALTDGQPPLPLPWAEVLPLLGALLETTRRHSPPRHVGGPLKQWLGYLRRGYPEARELFHGLKRLNEPEALAQALVRCAAQAAVAA